VLQQQSLNPSSLINEVSPERRHETCSCFSASTKHKPPKGMQFLNSNSPAKTSVCRRLIARLLEDIAHLILQAFEVRVFIHLVLCVRNAAGAPIKSA